MISLLNIEKNDKIMVALSGGQDSMCLMHLLLSMRDEYNLTLYAVNIDHSIRGAESEEDSLFVKNFCEKFNIKLYFYKVDAITFSNENGYTLEQGARILRYQIFNELLLKNEGVKLATAHHKSDNAESVLFNLFRGTGLKGVSGIKEIDGKIIRPLLNTSKNQIIEYVTKNDVPFRVDSTNFDSEYSRNYIRNEIFPIILKKFPDIINNINSFSKIAKEEDAFLDNLAKDCIIDNEEKLSIKISTSPVLFKRAVILIFKEYGLIKDYTLKHVESCFALISLENGSSFDLPKNIKAVKEYDYISFYNTLIKKDTTFYTFSEGQFKFNNFLAIIKKQSDVDVKNEIVFDKDKIPKNAVIRFRQSGDIFTKFGGGTKKLKDYFIDKKIERFKRDFYPLIAVGNEVLVIFDIAVSEKVKIDNNTKIILKAQLIKGKE